MKHSRTAATILLGSCLLLPHGTLACAQDRQDDHVSEQQKLPVAHERAPAGVTGTAGFGVFNKYIFRGYELSRDSIVFQPGLSASCGGFSASFWGNIDSREHGTQNFMPDRYHHRSFNETDVTLSYTKVAGKLSLTGGWVYYGTKYADETQEVFGTVAYDVIGKPTISIYRDFDRYPGAYFNLAITHSFKMGGDVTLDLGASAGYMWGNGSYWKTSTGSRYSAFHDGMLKAGLTIPVTGKISFVPLAQYWVPLSDKAGRRDYNPNGHLRSNLVGGASINYNF
jgi:hypothetical protein